MSPRTMQRVTSVWPLSLLLAFSPLGCASQKAADPAALKSAIESASTRFEEAFARRDAPALAQMYAEDAHAYPPGAPAALGRAGIEELWKGVLAMPVGRIRLETGDVGGEGSTAWESGRYILLGSNGATMDEGKYVVVWKHEESGWKLYRDIWNSDSPPRAPSASADSTTAR